MATIYVNKSGNDGNSGVDHANGKLTLQAGYTSAGSSGVIIVGSGTYAETVTVSVPLQTWYADGYVVVDGENLLAYGIHYSHGSNGTYPLSVLPQTTGGFWVFRRQTSVPVYQSANTTGHSVIVDSARFEDNSYGIVTLGVQNSNVVVTNCEFVNLSITATQLGRTINQFYTEYCTFYNCAVCFLSTYGSINDNTVVRDRGNIYHSCPVIYNRTSATHGFYWTNSEEYFSDNWYYNVTTYFDDVGTLYQTLAAFQAVVGSSRYTTNCNTTDPLLADPANGCLALQKNSPVHETQVYADYIGAWRESAVFSNASTFSGTWTLGTISSVDGGTTWAVTSGTVNKFGDYFEGYGTIVSPVFDLTDDFPIIKIGANFVNEIYPEIVIDADNNDTAPNRKNIEYRYQTEAQGSFNQDAVSPSWNMAEVGEVLSTGIPPTGVVGRYFQFRVTLRSDGVAA